MITLTQKFQDLKKQNRLALMPFFTAGYPNMQVFCELIKEADRRGASIIEIGAPFSDPIADGPAIQYSSYKALQQKVDLAKIFTALKKLAPQIEASLVMMSYYNPILQFGVRKFCKEARESGVSGLIIPDLPVGEDKNLEQNAKRRGLDVIYLLAPNATDQRIKLVTKHSRGFVYLVSVTGVTGPRKKLPPEILQFIRRIRKFTNKPLCLGFGISKAEHVKQLRKQVDGVIVGSAMIELVKREKNGVDAVKKAGRFLNGLSKMAR